MMLVLALLGGLAVVHYYLVPLDVLVVWRDPAALAIATDPEGADLHLDGTSLPRQSPTTAKVQRDLFDHVVEATSPGYLPARAKIRYDKSVGLSCLVRLKRDPLAAAAQAANVPTAAAPAPEPGASARTADPAPAPTPSTAPARR